MKNFIIKILLVTMVLSSCTKDFLEVKPDKKLVIPSTLDDMRALLDRDIMFYSQLTDGEVSSDDYYMMYNNWNILSSPWLKNEYIWKKEIFETGISYGWNDGYARIYYANNALDGLNRITNITDQVKYNNIKGAALFFRAWLSYQLAQLFCPPYDKAGTNDGLGIPLRLTSDLNVKVKRSTIKETYDQILKDLNESKDLLPDYETYKTRPVKTSAYALLSRVYLTMQEYDKALEFSELALDSDYSLINFNTLNTSASYPMTRFNSEVITHCKFSSTIFSTSRLIIDTVLFKSYNDNDIRKKAWFKIVSGNNTYKGSYDGTTSFFNGLSISECYLTKAECLARKGQTEGAMNVLNSLLNTRYKTGTFNGLTAGTSEEALRIVLLERRKELLYRGIRWTDLRRLNLNTATAKTLYRNLNGTIYELKPNSINYTLPIPKNVIDANGIEQNPRE
ncbi:MAG: hypothetical protein A2X18_11640 [Bacteroidetes bacterium GWF2_40_14]|nr:MAG: hypothetical protein A2X18_11640 [Bacteroidetes bacterium GWF2_40_14]